MLYTLAVGDAAQKDEDLEKLKQDRDRIKQKEIEVKREKSAVIARERSALSELKKIGKQLAAREKEVRVYRNNLARCEAEIKQLEKALGEAERRSKRTQEQMSSRFRALYKFGYMSGRLSYLGLLLGSDSISDLMVRYKYMSAIAIADKELLDKAIAEKAEIDAKKKEVEARKKRILYYKDGAERIKREILSKRQTRQKTLDRLQKSKNALTETLAELERSVNELEKLMAQLRRKSTEEVYGEITNLEERRGKLPWPVSGKAIGNSAPSMKGVTIQARYGADIRCVANGIVEYARWFDGLGFGQMVIVDHGNGYRTLYAHASELLVREGQRVKSGQAIAKVGDTGSIKGAILYFEIWKGTTAMSTRQWLR